MKGSGQMALQVTDPLEYLNKKIFCISLQYVVELKEFICRSIDKIPYIVRFKVQ